MKQIKRIIFVSNSGTCRAPMAAAILAQSDIQDDVEILARGLVVLMPEPLNQKAEAVLISNGFSFDDYSSKALEAEDIVDGTFVFTMNQEQKDKIVETYGYQHVFVLTDYVGEELEIMDPYGGQVQAYGICYETMSNTIAKLVEILKLMKGKEEK